MNAAIEYIRKQVGTKKTPAQIPVDSINMSILQGWCIRLLDDAEINESKINNILLNLDSIDKSNKEQLMHKLEIIKEILTSIQPKE